MSPRQSIAAIIAVVMLSFYAAPVRAGQGNEHVVPLSDLRGQVRAATAERAKNLADIEHVLANPAAQAELNRVNVGREQLTSAISQLDDHELARLAQRARAADQDIRAGGKGQILFLAGLAVVILLIVTLTQTL